MKWLVVALIIIVVALLIGVGYLVSRRKQDAHDRERAEQIRAEAAGDNHAREAEAARAREAKAEAEAARARAEQLEVRAKEQQTAHAQTEAQHEDSLRKADRIDPDVDHTADDYRPGATRTHTGETGETTTNTPESGNPESGTGGAHAGSE